MSIVQFYWFSSVCIGVFCLGDPYGNLPRPEKCPPDTFPPRRCRGRPFDSHTIHSRQKNPDACASGFLVTRTGISHGLKSVHRTLFPPAMPGSAFRFPHDSFKTKTPMRVHRGFCLGDPYGNRTHVTAVKGRCLNRLTNGPGSGNLTRTDDIPGMNRLLYQLSYAAKAGHQISFRRNQLRYYIRAAEKSQVFF